MRTVRLFFTIILLFLTGLNDSGAQQNTQKPEAAFRALKLRAIQGDPGAQVSLGLMYIQGTGVTQDYAEASKWLHMAAERGDRQAQGLLGSLYSEGLGVGQNSIEAYMWFDLALNLPGEGEDSFTQKIAEMRDSLMLKMAAWEIEESRKRVKDWFPIPTPIPVKSAPLYPEGTKPNKGATFSVRVDIVNVFVTVRDKKGNLVRDLRQEDFEIEEDGRRQNIQYFTREINLPLTIGLIVDTTPSVVAMLDDLRNASRIFLDRMLHPGKDRAFLIQYSDMIEVLQPVTSSRDNLNRSLGQIQGRPVNPPATVLGRAIYYSCGEIMKMQGGRKALILLGDGGHVGRYLEPAIEAARKADTSIYGIFMCDPGFETSRGIVYDHSQDMKNLELLARETGGAYFKVNGKRTLADIYSAIEEELRAQYNLGYVPDDDALDGYRTIKVTLKKRGLNVYYQPGYFPEE